ncbi:MAG: hypothetical protein K2X03_28205 [Bryobacteraceae bacterium]|nr:hypothetical protein [Bryobacteraceae bacterium]
MSTSDGKSANGSAHAGVTGCPIGVTDPQALVSGMYSARLQRMPNAPQESFTLVGLLNALSGGRLAINATSTIGASASVARAESDAGRYQVEPDCTTGTLTFNLSSRPAQYQFYFRAGFQTLDLISIFGPEAYGIATRF